MNVRLTIGAAGLAVLAMAGSVQAGLNSGCHARINWGRSMQDNLTNINIPAGQDTDLTFYVSIVGLRNLRGIDLELPMIGVGEANKASVVPPAWQFEPGAPCDNEENAQVSVRFPGCAVVGIKALITALCGVYQGTPERFPAFTGMRFIALTCAGAVGVDRDPAKRYGLARVTLRVTGKSCAGADGPVCIQPSLRMGHPKDFGRMIGVVDQNLAYDYAPMDPGFSHITANVAGSSCPAPTPAPLSVWNRKKGVIH